MTKPTREQVLELAHEFDLESQGDLNLSTAPFVTPARCAELVTSSQNAATIALALRLYAKTMGLDGGPVAEGPDAWLIRKGGYFYRPNCQGYTTIKAEAGRYYEAEARREAAVEPWHMSAILADDVK